MADEQIQEGFEVFVYEADKPFAAVRRASSHGKRELVISFLNRQPASGRTIALNARHSYRRVATRSRSLAPRASSARKSIVRSGCLQ
jgi:hypothetical protein